MKPHWAYLPVVALDLILDKLVEQVDHIQFGAVCKNWWTIAKLYHQNNESRGKLVPMLMIPTKRKRRSLYGIAAKREYPFKLRLPYNRKCCGFSHGWIATVDRNNVITLFHPFKNIDPISLPPIDPKDFVPLNGWKIHKVTLSADPATSPDDYVVATVYDKFSCLAFIKAGQKSWTYFEEGSYRFVDITFYEGLVFAVEPYEGIVSFDIHYFFNDPSANGKIAPNIILPQVFSVPFTQSAYLVKSLEGDLWMVKRFLSHRIENNRGFKAGTESFKVLKLELDAQKGKLLRMLELESLGDNALFVGTNDSISLSASYFSGCLQHDSIYYTNDVYQEEIPYHSSAFDLGFYNVKDESFGQHYPYYNHSFKHMPSSIWVLPPS